MSNITRAERLAAVMEGDMRWQMAKEEADTVAAELRRIPALEAERDRLLAALKAYDAWASKTPPRDAELYKIRQQMGQAILACETKEPK